MSDLNTMFCLYFGRNCPNGSTVSHSQFERFIADTVVEDFPEGFTLSEKTGAWKDKETGIVIRESTTVLEILARNDDRTRDIIECLAKRYAIRFCQDAVLVTETAVAAVAFVDKEYVSPETAELEREERRELQERTQEALAQKAPQLPSRIVALLTDDVDSAEKVNRLEEWSDAIDTVAENLYNRLPSGDYARGDVKRFVQNAIAKRLKARPTI